MHVDSRRLPFMRERLEFYLRDACGFAYDVVNAVLAADSDDVVDAIARAEALNEVRGSDDFASIFVAFKRIKNILRQAAKRKGRADAPHLEPAALTEDSEKSLAAAIPEVAAQVRHLREQKNYVASPYRNQPPSPAGRPFFDKVMVMVDDEKRARQSSGAVADLLREFSTIADFSEIVTETKSS